MTFEVETRFHFEDKNEVFSFLPEFKESFNKNINWETWHFGKNLFYKDIILRISKSFNKEEENYTLGYKEKDISQNIINIRKEIDEKIDKPIHSTIYSNILKGENIIISKNNISQKLFNLGYSDFMYFKGSSLLGYNQKHNLSVKLMFCNNIKYHVLLEIEKETKNKNDLEELSKELINFSINHKLEDRMIKKEPPALLYESIFE